MKKNSFIVFPEKEGHSGSCPEKLCVPPQEDLMRHFIAMIQGGDADMMRVCAGPALL